MSLFTINFAVFLYIGKNNVEFSVILVYNKFIFVFLGGFDMSTQVQFDNRRRERIRRERQRKKRIRAAIMLIALIGIVVLISVAISTCSHKNETKNQSEVVSVTPTPEAEAAPQETEQADNLPSASSENNLMKLVSNSGQDNRCYLTFDDGPTTNITPQILDILRRYNVKATFFEVGSLIEANTDMARRVYEEGHLLANHSDGHDYAKLYVSTDTFINEINKCYDLIKSVSDEEEPFRLVRFPGGSYKSDADSYSPVKQDCKEVLKQNGYYYCDWNALTGDAEGKKKNAEELLAYLKKTLPSDGSNVVILMHDAAAKQTTVDALPSVIEYMSSLGYTFHRLDDIDYEGPTPTVSPTATPSVTAAATASPSSASSSSNDATPAPSASPTPSTSTRPTTPPANTGGPIVIN